MNKRILLGIDAPISPATKYALRSMSEFVEQVAPGRTLPIHHLFGEDVITRTAALNHVAGQRVGRTAKSDNS